MDMHVLHTEPETTDKPAVNPMEQMFNQMVDTFAEAIIQKILHSEKHMRVMQENMMTIALEHQVLNILSDKFNNLEYLEDIESRVEQSIREYLDNDFCISDYQDEIQNMIEIDEDDITQAFRNNEFTITFV